ncbi:unnamed protein product [Amoebophrya sp. A25]|nr:unnamed protein product [Amoebophrya sp. A25]|eukprot:GSA25T00022767001.1
MPSASGKLQAFPKRRAHSVPAVSGETPDPDGLPALDKKPFSYSAAIAKITDEEKEGTSAVTPKADPPSPSRSTSSSVSNLFLPLTPPKTTTSDNLTLQLTPQQAATRSNLLLLASERALPAASTPSPSCSLHTPAGSTPVCLPNGAATPRSSGEQRSTFSTPAHVLQHHKRDRSKSGQKLQSGDSVKKPPAKKQRACDKKQQEEGPSSPRSPIQQETPIEVLRLQRLGIPKNEISIALADHCDATTLVPTELLAPAPHEVCEAIVGDLKAVPPHNAERLRLLKSIDSLAKANKVLATQNETLKGALKKERNASRVSFSKGAPGIACAGPPIPRGRSGTQSTVFPGAGRPLGVRLTPYCTECGRAVVHCAYCGAGPGAPEKASTNQHTPVGAKSCCQQGTPSFQ